MLVEELIELGLSKNEAEIYLALLSDGESSVSQIATRSGVHRRNVYDCLGRLLERGLVFEVQEGNQQVYQPVAPAKLQELIEERSALLKRIMPELQRRHRSLPRQQSFTVYRGIEGWKNCMRDIIRTSKDYFCIGGKGGWMDPRLTDFFPSFYRDLKAKKIACRTLFDYEVKQGGHRIQDYVGPHFRFLPEQCSTTASVEIYGDRVAFVTDLEVGTFREDFSLAVVKDKQLADAFRSWFELLWAKSSK